MRTQWRDTSGLKWRVWILRWKLTCTGHQDRVNWQNGPTQAGLHPLIFSAHPSGRKPAPFALHRAWFAILCCHLTIRVPFLDIVLRHREQSPMNGQKMVKTPTGTSDWQMPLFSNFYRFSLVRYDLHRILSSYVPIFLLNDGDNGPDEDRYELPAPEPTQHKSDLHRSRHILALTCVYGKRWRGIASLWTLSNVQIFPLEVLHEGRS